jgi:hypothetical protein
MRQIVGLVLEILGMLLLPATAFGFFVLVLTEALGTVPTLLETLLTIPLWAQAFLVVVCSLPVGLPLLMWAMSTSRQLRYGRDDVVALGRRWRDRR